MAGKRDAEGIALLSVYGDEESDDDDLEDAAASPPPLTTTIPGETEETPHAAAAATTGSIVDYAQDEIAPSPDHEEGEFVGEGSEGVGGDDDAMQVDDDGKELTADGREDGEVAETSVMVQDGLDNNGIPHPAVEEQDPLADFLPSPPHTPCSDELQAKFTKYSKLKEAGRSFNEELRNSKGYRNPDFLQHAVTHENIDQIGSCFKPDIFNPHGYDRSDFFDALVAEQRRETERKEQEKKQSQRTAVDFVRATSGPGLPPDLRPKPIIQILTAQKGLTAIATQQGLGEASHTVVTSTTTSSVVHTVTTSEVATKTEYRAGKKSKWDKAK